MKEIQNMKRFTSLLLVGFGLATTSAYAVRGRVQIKNGTVATDTGEMLRGCMTATDSLYGVNMPPKQVLIDIKTRGMNTLHLYGEKPSIPVGSRAHYIDTYVQWTKEEDLYLVLTIGDSGNDIAYILNFWDFYADRYKDETHVLFEIKNEPEHYDSNNPPYATSTVNMNRQAYDVIRAHAPDTHVMFFSYAAGGGGVAGATGVPTDVAGLGSGIDWSKASIAFHAYAGQGQDLEDYIYAVKDLGYPLVCTEFETDLTPYPNPARNVSDDVQAMENTWTSWLNFYTIGQMADDTRFKAQIDDAFIGWVPDFGSWPGISGPPVGKIITLRGYNREFVSCEASGDPMWCGVDDYYYDRYEQFLVEDAGNGKVTLRSVSNGKFVSGENSQIAMQCNRNWPSTWEQFTWTTYGNNNRISLQGSNGKYVSSNNGASAMWCDRNSVGGWERFTWLEGENYHLIAGTIEAEDFDVGGPSVAYHDTTAKNSGGAYRLDPSDVDIEVCSEGGYNLGWFASGEWITYTVRVTSPGAYRISSRVASTVGGQFRIEFNDVDKTGPVSFSSTGGLQDWDDVTVDVTLDAGWQVMRVLVESSGWKLNKFEISKL
ncbi:carbohydrate-binding protein [Coraliomargarita sp. SDUM461004]|uniref:Carbohydrate-binding protein n=2 Tax=Thalassobacterium sedimentorum TaxID=3041258 RepID=A0ABU1AG04_9BACT|nr:carbohydrate-binding protein [Coraliomargarita sp. SDUM461004]